MNEFRPPGGSRCSQRAPTPRWKTSTRKPYEASTESRLSTIALSGIRKERNVTSRTTKVRHRTAAITRGMDPKSSSSKSTKPAAGPPILTLRPAARASGKPRCLRSRTRSAAARVGGSRAGSAATTATRPSALAISCAASRIAGGRSAIERADPARRSSTGRSEEKPATRSILASRARRSATAQMAATARGSQIVRPAGASNVSTVGPIHPALNRSRRTSYPDRDSLSGGRLPAPMFQLLN